ncbi:MAG: DMT family transporter [Solirubrobacterales bacterium]
MTSPLLLGVVAALCWGSADFAARFSGRILGPVQALFCVMLAGVMALGLLQVFRGEPLFVGLPSWWAVGNGVAGLIGLALLYEGLRRGRVATVAPLAGAFPAWALIAMVAFQGVRPSAVAWAAMVATMVGVAVVARFSPADQEGDGGGRDSRIAVPAALGSGVMFGLALFFGQYAAAIHGEASAALMARTVGTVLLFPLFLARGPAVPPLRWGVVMAGQGALDVFGFLALLMAGKGEGGAVAAVVGSTFGLVTITLARIFLHERMTRWQWHGVALVFGGVAVLTFVQG